MTCELCNIISGECKAAVLFEDDKAFIAVRDHVLTPGQITVFPREHAPILEMIPNDVLGHCANLANAVGVAVFETLGTKGTNILVRNGLGAGQNIPHFSLEVIPRQDNDGLNLQWEPKQILEEEMDRVFVLLKQEMDSLKEKERKPAPPAEVKKTESIQEEKVAGSSAESQESAVKQQKIKDKSKEAENYLLKSIRRMP